ncbi:MAG: hypothetical protein ABI467_05820 [Kofleriaceae bacterium]
MKDIALQKFQELAQQLGVTTVSVDQARAIVGLGRLAIDADRTVDGDELDLYDDIADLVCEMAPGADPDEIVETEDRKPRGDDDRKARLVAAAGALGSAQVKDLAYAVAYLITIADLAIQPEEDAYLSALQDALAISDDRQSEIAAAVSDAIAE